MIGKKHDGAKSRVDLIPVVALLRVGEVLAFGARKYGEDNWQHVPQARDRYYAAALRHLYAWRDGEENDPESGLPHLAHAACCVLFLLWFDHRGPGLAASLRELADAMRSEGKADPFAGLAEVP